MTANVNRFLSQLARRIAPHTGVRNVVIPDIRLAEVFESLERQFQNDIHRFLQPAAIDYIDNRAVNEYWFIMMLAAALVIADSSPLTADDAKAGVLVLRRRFLRDNTMAVVFEKVKSGAFDRMSSQEMDMAKREGMVVWDVTNPHGDLMRINPAYFL